MCDTLCVRTGAGMLFGKNSDRPPREPQVLEWHGRRTGGGGLRTQYLTIPDPGAHALAGSRPAWLWGLEHGVNEHRVAIGNEKVWTVDDARAETPALLGMDLVRLGLERASNADDAVDIVTTLLAAHGQGGSGELEHDEPYFSSFLVADPDHGWVIETSGRTWAARQARDGTSISNRISLRTDWTRASGDVAPGTSFDQWRDPEMPTALADRRLAATRACVAQGVLGALVGPRDVAAALRDHGHGPWGPPGTVDPAVSSLPAGVGDDWSGVTVCMHVRGYQATTASMVAELRRDAPLRAWACLGSPCAGVYVPVFPPAIPDRLGDALEWARFAALRERVEADADALPTIRAELAPVEAALWEEAEVAYATGARGSLDAFTAGAYAPIDAALRRLGV